MKISATPSPSDILIPNCELRYEGVQKRKNHHTPSVRNLPSTMAHVCLRRRHSSSGILRPPAAVSVLPLSCRIYRRSASFTCGFPRMSL